MKLSQYFYYMFLAAVFLGAPATDVIAKKSDHKKERHAADGLSWPKNPDYVATADPKERVCLLSSLPWEVVKDNVKTWKFLLINYDPATFNNVQLDKVAGIVEEYIDTYFFPTYRVKVQIDMITPPSDAQFIANDLPPRSVRSLDVAEIASHIPIYLVNEFSPDIPNGFGIAFHGQVNDSVMNGIHPWFYLNPANDLTGVFNALCPGMPFIIIPRGSVGEDGTDNGIEAEIAHSLQVGYGPTQFYDALAYILAYQVIEVLENPASLLYVLSGNTLEEFGAGSDPRETAYLKSLCAPFSSGSDNIRSFKGFSMPNFALPSYFHPYVDQLSHGKAVYDSMGNGSAPLTPYKGTQFVMYQEKPLGVLSDLQAGIYTSTVDDPFNLLFNSFGSIYSWEGWGFQLAQNTVDNGTVIAASIPEVQRITPVLESGKKNIFGEINFEKSELPKMGAMKTPLKATAHGLFPGRKQTATTIAAVAKKNNAATVRRVKNASAHKCFNPKHPNLLPFQYINENGWLTQRYAIINYSQKVDLATLIETTQNVVDAMKRLFLPHWNIMVQTAIYDVSSATTREEALALLPEFDGTFVPVFIVTPSQFNTETAAVGLLAGGAFDVNNVPDVLAGPTIDYYIVDNGIFPVPGVILGQPLVSISDHNFNGSLIVTTDDPSVPGPFTMGVASFEPSGVTFPFTRAAVINQADLTMCETPADNTPFENKVLVFTNNPPCPTAGPQRYTNVNNSTAYASIAVPFASSTFGFPSNLGLPYVTEPSTYMVGTSAPEGNALVAAIQKATAEGRTINITFNEPTFPIYASVQGLSEVLSHEFMELAKDPNYATYVATSNPPADQAIVFHQYEAADPIETPGGPRTLNAQGKIFRQSSFPTPAYFIPNLKFKLYDDQGLCPKNLIPIARQQTVVHQAPIQCTPFVAEFTNQPLMPMQFLSLENSIPGAVYSQSSFAGFDIYDPTNYFQPFNELVLFPPEEDFHNWPWYTIYHKLLTNDNLFAYDNVAIIGPNSGQTF